MNEIIIQLNGITKNFKHIKALDNISFHVGKGELFGIVGPDGAGKTTLMKILCGVEIEYDGELLIFGRNATKNRREINKRIGYLSQRFSLYGDLTIDENIEFYARIHGVKNFKQRREYLLEFTRLKEFRKRFVDKLSGGMKQKTALACALIHQPEILILDEPTNGVDPVSRRDFWKILAELQRQNITIIISTPYLEETERCGRIAILNKGELIAIDKPENLKKVIRENVFEFICSPVREAYHAIKNNFKDIEIQMFGDSINIISDKSIDIFIKFLTEKKIHLINYRQKPPSIENVFIHLLEKEAANEI